MKKLMIILSVLFLTFGMSCTNNDLKEVQNDYLEAKGKNIISRSVSGFDYSQYILLEKRTVMPRIGESYQGAVIYENTAFPLWIFWDLEQDYYNLYAYISGYNFEDYLLWDGSIRENNLGSYNQPICSLTHVNTYYSDCSSTRFDFVIKCNFSRDVNSWNERKYVAFHVTFYPWNRYCYYDIIEEGEGYWDSDI